MSAKGASLALVKELRERTGAGVVDCQKALTESGGDVERAITFLREKGLAAAAKRAGRSAAQGVVGSYIHGGGKIGVLLEVNCETDFVARTEEFQKLVKDVAMQIAAANPRYVRRDEVSEAERAREREFTACRQSSLGSQRRSLTGSLMERWKNFLATSV